MSNHLILKLEEDIVTAVIRYQKKFNWYRCPKEQLILDLNKWNQAFIDFCDEYNEAEFPTKDKFWVKGDSDLLKLYTK